MDSWNSDFWLSNSAYCAEELKKNDIWDKIPLINTTPNHLLKEGSLVRFCGMVQDMYNPVYYLASYEVLNTVSNEKSTRSGKYKDTLECAEHERVLLDSEASVNEERRPVYCISVPAVNRWAQYVKSVSKEVKNQCSESCGSGIKRSAEEEKIHHADGLRVTVGNKDSLKKLCLETEHVAMETEEKSRVNNLNLPIPNNEAEACLVNFYDVEEGRLQLNELIEVAGFLSFDVGSYPEQELPPPSLVPRLHAVAFRPAPPCNPLVTPQINISDVMRDAPRLRDELKLVLTQLLLGDDLAADYLICHLLSYIYMRQDVMVLGKFSLNLSHLPRLSDYSTKLYEFLQRLLTKSHFFPMTLDNMNNTAMIPKKNYESDRLESGMLQLSRRTHLVLDETRLQPGQLNDKGVKNCVALSSVIKNQKIEYDFQFYPVEFNTDIPVLILSEGKSLLPADCQVALSPDPLCLCTVNELFTAVTHYLKEPLLSQLRVYLTIVPTASYDLSEEVQKIVQDDFVKMRQNNSKTSAQDLHSLLVLAKLLSLSRGCQSLTNECWESACKMEQKRKERLHLSS